MKILLTSIGTRGDIEPFLAVGERLEQRGHQVVFLFLNSSLLSYRKMPVSIHFHPK